MQDKKSEGALLDLLARRMRCFYLSDLKYLDAGGRAELARQVRGLEAGCASCREWNDALLYLGGAGPCADAQAARGALLRLLESRA